MAKLTVIAAVIAAAACTSPRERDDRAPRAAAHDTWDDTVPSTEGDLMTHMLVHVRRDLAQHDAKRAAQLDRLHGRLVMAGVEDALLRGVVDVVEMTEPAREDVEAKLDVMTNRLDQAELVMDKLDEAQDREFAAVAQDAREAMKAFDAARAAAWKAVGEAKRPSQAPEPEKKPAT
jgi:hypothetical protein